MKLQFIDKEKFRAHFSNKLTSGTPKWSARSATLPAFTTPSMTKAKWPKVCINCISARTQSAFYNTPEWHLSRSRNKLLLWQRLLMAAKIWRKYLTKPCLCNKCLIIIGPKVSAMKTYSIFRNMPGLMSGCWRLCARSSMKEKWKSEIRFYMDLKNFKLCTKPINWKTYSKPEVRKRYI